MKTTIAVVAIALLAAEVKVAAAGDADAGKQKSAVCQSCHGVDGNSANAQFPTLAGQHADYLVKALKDYKSGERSNPIMAGFVANLTERDMEDLAAYYTKQKGLRVQPPKKK